MDEGDHVPDMQAMARPLWEKRAKARGADVATVSDDPRSSARDG